MFLGEPVGQRGCSQQDDLEYTNSVRPVQLWQEREDILVILSSLADKIRQRRLRQKYLQFVQLWGSRSFRNVFSPHSERGVLRQQCVCKVDRLSVTAIYNLNIFDK